MSSARLYSLVLVVFTLTTLPQLAGSQSLESEDSLQRYEAKFRSIPKTNDSRWQNVPIEEWEKTFQFLADSANSNLERLRTWNASYNLVKRVDLSSFAKTLKETSTITEDASRIPSYYIMKQRYAFYRDNEDDKSYISLARQGDLIFYNNQNKIVDYHYSDSQPIRINERSNLKAIVTPDRLLTYEYDRDLHRPETLQQLGYEEFGKYCVVLPPDRHIGKLGLIFDPQFFFMTD